MAQTETGIRIKQVGTVMVPVADQDRALEFYVGVLGFEKRTDTAYGEGMRWVEVAPPGAATSVALVPPGENATTGGHSRVAFDTDDVDDVHATLRERGVDVDESVMRMGDPVPPMFWFRDPDGNSHLMVQGA